MVSLWQRQVLQQQIQSYDAQLPAAASAATMDITTLRLTAAGGVATVDITATADSVIRRSASGGGRL